MKTSLLLSALVLPLFATAQDQAKQDPIKQDETKQEQSSVKPAAPEPTNNKPQAPGTIFRIIRVRGDAKELASMSCPYTGFSPVECRPSATMRAIVVKGRAEDVAQVQRTIQELDSTNGSGPNATLKNIETTIYVISGSAQEVPGAAEAGGPELLPVVKQLKSIFPYSHYQLMSSMLLRSSENSKADSRGLMRGAPGTPGGTDSMSYIAGYRTISALPDSVPLIRVEGFHFTAARGGNVVEVNTNIDLTEGQKVVVGKANVSDADTCFFIVLSARLVR